MSSATIEDASSNIIDVIVDVDDLPTLHTTPVKPPKPSNLQLSPIPELLTSRTKNSTLSPSKSLLIPTLIPKHPSSQLSNLLPTILKRLDDLESENHALKKNYQKLTFEFDQYKFSTTQRIQKLQSEFNTYKLESSAKFKSLQHDLQTCKSHYTALKSEHDEFKELTESRYKADQQYSRRNSILIHNLRNVPANCHGSSFSQYVAHQINRLLPHLAVQVRGHHISASHPLNHENLRSPIVVRFVNRDQRNDIYRAREYVTDQHAYITEHLISDNQQILTAAQHASSYKDAWSHQGKVYMKIKGNTKRISSVDEVPPKPAEASNPSHDRPSTSKMNVGSEPRNRSYTKTKIPQHPPHLRQFLHSDRQSLVRQHPQQAPIRNHNMNVRSRNFYNSRSNYWSPPSNSGNSMNNHPHQNQSYNRDFSRNEPPPFRTHPNRNNASNRHFRNDSGFEHNIDYRYRSNSGAPFTPQWVY